MPFESDFLVIGSGMAGLIFALKAAEVGTVFLITKKQNTESNTNYAQGGIAAVFDADDSVESHFADTIKAGAGLCHEDAVRVMVEEGPALVKELMSVGVQFSQTENGRLQLGREGGHSSRRIVHAEDLTGQKIEHTLVKEASHNPKIKIFENHTAIDLIISERRCWGAYVLDNETLEVKTYLAKVIFLATGGGGQVYLHTTNPSIATGDGMAMAYRAGAKLANLEFVQFHPTTLYHSLAKSFLISEAVRGEGAILRDKDGKAFMSEYHKLKDLAPRDIVARAIDSELKKSGEHCVFLDLSAIPPERKKERFPNIYKNCLSYGIDITQKPIPVVPAAHYLCGGVLTDIWGQTSIEGLYAAGETACSGVHGANRLASNSLLEALVFAERAAQKARQELNEKTISLPIIPGWDYVGSVFSQEKVVVSHNREEVQRLMWDYVGIVRTEKRLLKASERLKIISQEIRDYYWKYRVTTTLLELRNLVTLAQLIVRCALLRKESRGLHYNLDYPERDDEHFRKDTIISK
ncbi:MAG: L-aspartate oxidase [Candidatus Edwardsbacteria bacterium]